MGPTTAEERLRQGTALHRGGQLEAAERLYRQVLDAEPGHPAALQLLGALRLRQGRPGEAIPLLEQAVRLRPDRVDACVALGAAHQAVGNLDGAEHWYRKGLALAPDDAGLHNALGAVLQALGRLDAAEASFRTALARDPRLGEAHYNLGALYLQRSRTNEAVAYLRRAVSVSPGHGRAHARLAEVLADQGDVEDGTAMARRAVALAPQDPGVQEGMARVFADAGEWDDAVACYDRVLEAAPDRDWARIGKAAVLGSRGDVDAALALVAPFLEGQRPEPRAALVFGLHAGKGGRRAEALEVVERVLARDDLDAQDRKSLCFAAGHLHDALKDYDAAFARYAEANRLAGSGFDAEAEGRAVERLTEVFSADRMAAYPRAADRSERPVFIVGMPRSGTTLVEQILAAHPQVHGAGELHDVERMAMSLPGLLHTATPYPDCVEAVTGEALDALAGWFLERLERRAPEAARVTDKMPHNFRHLGFIALCLPGARVIHCARDPVDTCLSCHFQDFAGHGPAYKHDLADLGQYYRGYRRLMRHWQEVLDLPLMTVRYEELVAEPERVSRALVDFCGLPWDERCLRFHASGRFVKTASRDQVNRPVYRSSVGRRHHYAAHLGPLLEALGPEAE